MAHKKNLIKWLRDNGYTYVIKLDKETFSATQEAELNDETLFTTFKIEADEVLPITKRKVKKICLAKSKKIEKVEQ